MEMEISDEIRITSTDVNRPTEWTMHEQCVWHAGASKQNAAALSCRRPTCCQAGVLPVTASSNHSIVCITRRCRLRQLGTPPDAGEETFYLRFTWTVSGGLPRQRRPTLSRKPNWVFTRSDRRTDRSVRPRLRPTVCQTSRTDRSDRL